MKKILVIDDEPLLLDLLTHLLSFIGYKVDRALDGHEGAGKLKDEEYDLIFLDIKMPFMNGIEFYCKIKQSFPHLAKRVVFLTGDVASKETFHFIQETENLNLQKPFTIKEVKNLLERFFQVA
jgi:CheY-like chemotaxis protein